MTSVEMQSMQDLFYRCKFSDLLKKLGAYEAISDRSNPELALLKANTLYELQQVNQAKSLLRDLQPQDCDFNDSYLYAVARLSYLEFQHTKAREIFETIYKSTSDVRYRFKSLLGIANTYYSEKSYDEIPAIIIDLLRYEPLERADERISLTIFLGSFYFASNTDLTLAKQYFKKALAAAACNAWTYFIVRCLYFIAAIHEEEGRQSELMWTLDLLQSFVDESEQVFFTHLVNKKFKRQFSINTQMEFDVSNRRIMLKDRWLAFQDKPLLFRFLHLLHASGTFLSKEDIAHRLWPNEAYKPWVHDPRINDIAKRARHAIEPYENHPMILLSGQDGFKLASS